MLYPGGRGSNWPLCTRRGIGLDLCRLRSGPFEGPATVKPPALPEDNYEHFLICLGWFMWFLGRVYALFIPWRARSIQDRVNEESIQRRHRKTAPGIDNLGNNHRTRF